MHKFKKISSITKSVLILLAVAGLTPAGATNMFDSPPGFLVPTKELIPEGYTLFARSAPRHKDLYGAQFDRWTVQNPNINKKVDLGNGATGVTGFIGVGGRARDAQLFFAECFASSTDTYETRIDYHEHDKMSVKLKDFTFEGSPGAIFKQLNYSQRERETYDLLWKDGNRILTITNVFEEKQPNYSSDTLLAMLAKFKRLE